MHPPGTLEEYLSDEDKLGTIDPDALPKEEAKTEEKSPKDDPPPLDSLLNLDEIEEVASKKISRKAWAYYYSAGDDLISKRLNNEVYQSILLRPRIFVDCEHCDPSTTIMGCKVGLPIFVSPAAMARLAEYLPCLFDFFHDNEYLTDLYLLSPAGEAGIARACSRFTALQIISNNASMTPEQIVADAEPGQAFGWQMYCQTDRKKSEDMLARVNAIPSVKFICLTLDAPVPGKREDDERSKNVGSSLPVTSSVESGSDSKEISGGIGKSLFAGTSPNLTWKNTLPWLAEHTKLPILLKGIQTHEDAYLASLHAPEIKGILLSNHGGRAADTAPPAVHTLLEIRKYCPEVFRKVEVLVDGGIRRGTDVVKALCLGARGVGIGRAALFGLGAGGVAGVERTLESKIPKKLVLSVIADAMKVLDEELQTAMRLLGANSIGQLSTQNVGLPPVNYEV